MNDQISLLSFFFLRFLSKKQSKKFMKIKKKKSISESEQKQCKTKDPNPIFPLPPISGEQNQK